MDENELGKGVGGALVALGVEGEAHALLAGVVRVRGVLHRDLAAAARALAERVDVAAEVLLHDGVIGQIGRRAVEQRPRRRIAGEHRIDGPRARRHATQRRDDHERVARVLGALDHLGHGGLGFLCGASADALLLVNAMQLRRAIEREQRTNEPVVCSR